MMISVLPIKKSDTMIMYVLYLDMEMMTWYLPFQ